MSGTAEGAAFAPKRIQGAEVYDRRDGSWVVLDARSGRHVVLDERQAAIARRLDGRPLADVARETLDERGTIPFGELLGLCRALAAEGLLQGGDGSLTGKPSVFERVRRVSSVTLAQRVLRSKRLEQIAAANPKVAGKRVLGMQAIAGAAGGMLLAAAGAPVIERVLLPAGNPRSAWYSSTSDSPRRSRCEGRSVRSPRACRAPRRWSGASRSWRAS
jgi:hypothetical protein